MRVPYAECPHYKDPIQDRIFAGHVRVKAVELSGFGVRLNQL